jgi:cyclophilin family peptidyl-prolyl cis-trans isomerase
MLRRLALVLLVIASVLALSGFQSGSVAPRPGETLLVLNVQGKGEVVIKLYTREAPKATAQVIRLTEGGFYNGLKFHRVVTTPRPFLVQFGDPQSKTAAMGDPSLGKGGSGQKVPYEDSGIGNLEGAVGLSTPQGQKNDGDSQFYINLGANRFLDGTYTVFGQVVKGMDVVKAVVLGDLVTSATIKRG